MRERFRAARFPALWAVFVIAAEVLGRRSPSDVWDAIGVFGLAVMLALSIPRLMASGRVPLRVYRVGLRAWSAVRRWWPETGVDLRGTPPLARGFPPGLTRVALAAAALTAIAFLARGAFPGPAREAVLAVSPTLGYLGLGALWAALLALLCAGGFLAWLELHDALQNADVPAPRRRWIEGLAALAWLSLLVLLVALAPTWLCWLAIGAAAALGVGAGRAIDRYEPLLWIWRTPADPTPRVFTAGAGIAWNCGITAALLFVAAVVGAGEGWPGARAETAPITIGLGSAAAWSGALAFLLWSVFHTLRPAGLLRNDPARPRPIELRLAGLSELTGEGLRRLREHGFRPFVEGAARGERAAVTVELDPAAPARPAARTCEGSARVRVRPDALVRPSTLAEIRRVDAELRREALLDGLGRLFEIAAERRFSRGTGFWLAPHLWYVIGMTRDADDGDFWTIGPPYHKLLPLAARAHLHGVLRALEVDLVFAEDGVAFADLEAVFRRLFDVIDVLGPGRIDEKDFAGLPRVRVLLHDYALGDPLERDGYPEPDYDEIGRARILHVMRDRGGDEEAPDALPATPERQPELAPA